MTESHIPSARTLIGVLRARAAETPHRLAFEFSADGDEVRDSITFGQLYSRALRVAARIRAHAGGGTPVMLMFPAGLEFIEALFGTFAAGAIAVPCYPPSPTRASQHLERLTDVARAAAAGLVLTTENLRAQFVGRASFLAADRWMTMMDAAGRNDVGGTPSEAAAEAMEPGSSDVALVQFTSGSTSQPRGVVIPHRALMANQEAIRQTFGTSETSRIFTWLPFYHDMGLIGQVLHPVYLGASCSIIPPLRFMQSPQRWLLGMTRFRATITAAPNAAYDLCRQLVPDSVLPQIDLSSLQVAINGAEPVRHDTLVGFARRFEACGFTPRAFRPAYGLAENTLLVSAAHSEHGPPSLCVEAESLALGRFAPTGTSSGKPLVSAGRPVAGTRVTIVDAADLPCPAGVVGEVLIEGDSVGHGYRTAQGPDTTTFQPPRAPGEAWGVKTGDLGCLWDGQLFIVGRSKDVVIVGGRNIFPQDIERTVGDSHPGFSGTSGAAFGVARQDREGLVVVHGYRRQFRDTLPELARAARTAVRDAHEVAIQDFVFVEAHGIPRTSSGKIQRRKCRELYLADTLPRATAGASKGPEPRDEPASQVVGHGPA